MALGQPGQDNLDLTGEDILSGLSTIPQDTPGYGNLIQQYMLPQANIPAQPQPGQEPHPFEVAQNHTVAPESQPLVGAIDSGYADKKIMKPIEDIREGIKAGDHEQVKKGHKSLSDLLLGEQTFGQWYQDTFFYGGRDQHRARSMAGDIVMKELQRHTGAGQPSAIEAQRLGLIDPEELIPGEQSQENFAHLIPQEPFTMDAQGIPATRTEMRPEPAQPGQEPHTTINPGAQLTPLP